MDATKVTHTPGEWRVDGADIRAPGAFVAHVKLSVDAPDQHAANAHLIAAAPDMLAALEGLFSDDYLKAEQTVWAGPGGTMPEVRAGELIDARQEAARAAIRKARGEE